ncbi:MAG: hypothetical protein KDC67_14190 [Ignavibacteriae bacterium]|nr:hypothetical protein [Ignavibacteriota bacterium]
MQYSIALCQLRQDIQFNNTNTIKNLRQNVNQIQANHECRFFIELIDTILTQKTEYYCPFKKKDNLLTKGSLFSVFQKYFIEKNKLILGLDLSPTPLFKGKFTYLNDILLLAFQIKNNRYDEYSTSSIKKKFIALSIKPNRINYIANLYLTALLLSQKVKTTDFIKIIKHKKTNSRLESNNYRDQVFYIFIQKIILRCKSRPQKELSLSQFNKQIKKSTSVHLAISLEKELIPYEQLVTLIKVKFF